MSSLFQVVGAAVVVAFLAGAVGIIDFYVCIKGPGECNKEQLR